MLSSSDTNTFLSCWLDRIFGCSPSRDLKWDSQLAFLFSWDLPFSLIDGLDLRPVGSLIVFQVATCHLATWWWVMFSIFPWMNSASAVA